MDWIGYIIVLGYVAIAFWAVLMGIDKMAKVVIGNYLSGITCYAFGNLLYQGVKWLASTPDATFIGIKYAKYAEFLSAGQLTLVLLLYTGLIWLIYACGKIQVSFSSRSSTEKLYFIFLIPITVLSFVIGPYIALKADGIVAIGFIETTLKRSFGFLISFINNISLWMFVNGIAFIILSSQVNFKISLSAKATKLPDGI